MWNGDALLERLYNEAVSRHQEQSRKDLRNERRPKLKEALRDVIGYFEPNAEHAPKLLERVQCDGYVRERVELSATPELTFAAYVLIPDGPKESLPAVLAIHGHGYGSREIVGLLKDGSPDEGEPGIHQHFAVQLVKRGMVVIAPDVIGFGERRLLADLALDENAPSSCYKLSTQLMTLGKTLTGLRVTEVLAAFNYLSSRSEVDANRIGVMGFSGGGLIGYAAAVLEARINATVLTGFTNTMKDSIFAIHHCVDNYTPGLLVHAELPELIGLIAPRPLFLESGERDPIFPVAGFRKAVAEIQAIYEEENASDMLGIDVFPGAHEISGRVAYDWLKQTLSS
ncbi:dienelactone hydrolase [Paenibacillus sp. FSL H8-0548]|uniref:dienelactone hydrolase family protein n=1 Tax=Paenibacillus sp. FSL H8-0548 TaxID=1920422 RepID=UPI00096CE9B5|nr:alpha/beta hydrolase family protein [Paenibacillus sp. FSL H8-0548]OMF21153.1 dienelactone hydrolase [Paenibacillus sp. FSL H8-0548]